MKEGVTLEEIRLHLPEILEELADLTGLREGQTLVVGCSSSEILGANIGKGSSLLVGRSVAEVLVSFARERGLQLAVQGCEHINRSLVVERRLLEQKGLTEVSVVPALHAGGSTALAAYALAEDPVMVESVVADVGLDIGDTSIGQYVRAVQVPVRLSRKELGGAHLTCLRSRPRLIGGVRATYAFDRDSWEVSCREAEQGDTASG